MTNKLAIINRALGLIGERSITNPDAPETPAGKHMVSIFDQCRREVLRRVPWNFAEVWKATDKTTTPDFGYADAYVLPSDFLRLLIVGYSKPSSSAKPPLTSRRDYRLLYQPAQTQRVIAIDNDGEVTLKIAYTADITVYSIWDPLAIKVLAVWMALDGAKAITGQNDLVKTLNALLTEELRDAAGVDGGEQAIMLHLESPVQTERSLAQYGDLLFTPVNFKI